MPLNWKVHLQTFPLLSILARNAPLHLSHIGGIERVFNTAGDVVTAQRSCLSPEQVDILIFLKNELNFIHVLCIVSVLSIFSNGVLV